MCYVHVHVCVSIHPYCVFGWDKTKAAVPIPSLLYVQVLGDHNKAVAVIRDAMAKDSSSNPLLLYLQLLDLETSRTPPSQSAVEAIFEEVQASSDINDMSKAMFTQRKVAFLEEFGYDISK